jgi:hypothetical protein
LFIVAPEHAMIIVDCGRRRLRINKFLQIQACTGPGIYQRAAGPVDVVGSPTVSEESHGMKNTTSAPE